MASRVSRSGLSSAMQSPPARRDLTSAPSPSSACGRAVGGDHHPAAQIGKGVDGVEELRRRGGGAADMLQIVDDQHFGGAQLFLEGQRVLAIERAQEVAHEILGPQEQGALAALAEFQRRGIQQMGLAEAETAMDVEQRNVGSAGLRRRLAAAPWPNSLAAAGNEAVEGLLGMQHPGPQARGAVFLGSVPRAAAADS